MNPPTIDKFIFILLWHSGAGRRRGKGRKTRRERERMVVHANAAFSFSYCADVVVGRGREEGFREGKKKGGGRKKSPNEKFASSPVSTTPGRGKGGGGKRGSGRGGRRGEEGGKEHRSELSSNITLYTTHAIRLVRGERNQKEKKKKTVANYVRLPGGRGASGDDRPHRGREKKRGGK